MSSLYNGVAPNVSLGGTANITIPADGDPDSAATVNVPFQKGTDYLEALRQAVTGAGPWIPAWAGNTAYTVNQVRSNAGNAYICVVAGTSAASGGPTTTGTNIVDNTAQWNYIAALSSGGLYSQALAGAAAGLLGEGGPTGPGVFAIAGGGAAPARGALSLNPQAAPSAPSNGDVWATSAAAFVRVNGVTQQILFAGQAPVMLPFGMNLTAVNFNTSTEYMLYASAAPPANTLGVTPVSDTSVASGNAAYLMPFAGHLGTVQCRSNVAPTPNTYQFKVYKNGSLVLTPAAWSGAGTTFTFDASSVTFVAGDRIAITFSTNAANNTGFFWSAVAPAFVV